MSEPSRPGSDAADRYLLLADISGYTTPADWLPPVIVTEPAASRLGIAELGIEHQEAYPDVGTVDARIIDLAELRGMTPNALGATPA